MSYVRFVQARVPRPRSDKATARVDKAGRLWLNAHALQMLPEGCEYFAFEFHRGSRTIRIEPVRREDPGSMKLTRQSWQGSLSVKKALEYFGLTEAMAGKVFAVCFLAGAGVLISPDEVVSHGSGTRGTREGG